MDVLFLPTYKPCKVTKTQKWPTQLFWTLGKHKTPGRRRRATVEACKPPLHIAALRCHTHRSTRTLVALFLVGETQPPKTETYYVSEMPSQTH